MRAVDLEAVQLGEHLGRLDTRRPDDHVRGKNRARRRVDAAVIHCDNSLVRENRNGKRAEETGGRLGDLFGQQREDARRGFEKGQPHVARGIEVIETIARERVRAVADLGGELDAGRTGADDHDVDGRRFAARRAPLRAHARRDEAPVEALGVDGSVERDRMLGNAGHAEIVADAADAKHERVVGQHACRQNLLAVVVEDRREVELVPRTIETIHRAEPKPEMVPVRHEEVIDVVQVGVHPSGGDLVQQRLPQVRREAVDERDGRASAPAQRVAELGRERKPARRRRRR